MTQETISFRQGSLQDLAALKHLAVASYGQYRPELTEDNWQQLHAALTSDSISTLLQQAHTFVCCVNEKVVGMAFLLPSGHPTDIYPANWCQIRMVGVHPAHSGRGIGRTLVAQCIERVRTLNESTVALHTSEFMHVARNLYEELGFTMVKEIPKRFGKRYWLYTLQV